MTTADRQLHLGVNMYNAGIHVSAWRKQEDPFSYLDVDFYRDIARIAERGTLDAVFLADIPGLREDARARPTLGLEPTVLLTGVAAATERIGLVATASTTFNDPYNIARRFSTLDHVSRGRAAWNAVTTYDPTVAPNFGLPELPEHHDRYGRAEEFVDVVRKLWDSWEDGALVGDQAGDLADPDRIHAVEHRGEHFSVRGPLPLPRSPQGRPVLVQAGGSEHGKRLAARTADAVFAAQTTFDEGRRFYAEMKQRARDFGRNPDALKILPGLCTVIAATEAEAKARKAELDELGGQQWAIGKLAANLGVPVDQLELDAPVPEHLLRGLDEKPGSRGFAKAVADYARADGLTVRELALLGGGGHRYAIGTPEQIADTIEHWFRNGAADGFNLMPDVLPSGLETFVDHVVPELRRRGLFRTEYTGTTLREHLGLSRPPSRYETETPHSSSAS
ncbi:LLM class flavin-dependent oxidoreductase [Saccharopolyspora gloriosae]|uniref:LLM class flavin-dependent oxidoreductase n=1 Tax=Saccharopolyspora gloriosae TaxID=455344 RepID=UPI001FB76FDF|nr:LLM class flavin-dependent oxidoreductase [Saccharopolyspora gloriosae]